MQSWNPYPFFRLLLPFSAGILLAIYGNLPQFISKEGILIAAGILLFAFVMVRYIRSYTWRWLPGLVLNVFLLVAGYALTLVQTPRYEKRNIINTESDFSAYVIKIAEPFTPKVKSLKTTGKLLAAYDSAGLKPVSGKVLLYFQKDSAISEVSYGDILIIKSKVALVEPPGNPHQFDYRRFLSYSGIYHQAYVRSDSWMKTSKSQKNPLFDFAYSAREKMLSILHDTGLSGDEYHVVSAILLGYDDLMDRELRQKYSGAGALHVLCVSGLHVGILFLLLNFVLKPLSRNRWLRLLKVVLLLSGIWIYAFITGLSPSVMRAAVMFSLFALREARRQKSNPYNILAASAFILLIIDPYMITKIGFQLSYSAVLAIISLYQPIYNLLAVKNKILDYFWQLTVVSFAAQIGTFPFAIFYFHQFPVYFFLTNIIVIPLVWLILNTGIAVLLLSAVSSFLASWLAKLLFFMLAGLNGAVDFIHRLPGATVHGLVLSLVEVVLIYAAILFLSRAILSKAPRFYLITLSLLIMLSMSLIWHQYMDLQQSKLIVYQVNRHSGIEYLQGRNSVLLADSALLNDSQLLDFNISSNQIYAGIQNTSTFDIDALISSFAESENIPIRFYEPCFMAFANKRIAIVDRDFEARKIEKPLGLDAIILRDNPKVSIEQLSRQFTFKQLVFDASNKPWKTSRWKLACDSLDVQYHDVNTEGYFSFNE